jgi:hypothetical protein
LTAFVVFTTGEKILDRCLTSVRDAVDEIVAVDTGAQDGARAVAERAGARVYDLVWPDSFAAAYNFAIDQVATEWTLWLDSDEWLVEGEQPRLAAAIERDDVFLYNLIRQDYADETHYSEMLTPRLWRTHPSMRLRGVCHARFTEAVRAAACAGRKTVNSNIRFGHDGFIEKSYAEKARRNLKYLRLQMLEPDADLYDEICLREAEYVLDEPDAETAMLELGERILADAGDAPTELLAMCVIQACLDSHIRQRRESEFADRLVELGLKWFAEAPAVRWFSALYLIAVNRIPDAYTHLLALEKMSRTGRYDGYLSFDPAILGEGLYRNLAAAAERLGDRAVAARAHRELARLRGVDWA